MGRTGGLNRSNGQLEAPATGPDVRPLEPGDLAFAAALHRRALPHGFFSRLGEAYLRAYYHSFLVSPHGVALVAVLDGRPLGTLVGTRNNREHYGWVAQRLGRRLAWQGALSLACRPRVAISFLRHRGARYARSLLRMRNPSPGPSQPRGAAEPDVAVLTHVSVSEDARGRGTGRALVRAFLEEADQAGVGEARLVTLSDDGAGAFYGALGWSHQGDRPGRDDETVSAYSIVLPDRRAS